MSPFSERVIVALDYPTRKAALDFLESNSTIRFVKVGMELFFAEGLSLVLDLKMRGLKVFLDLKLHDIPNTASSALRVLAPLSVDIVNVHCSGGRQMLEECKTALQQTSPETKIIGVTVLTSLDKTSSTEIFNQDGDFLAIRWAKLAHSSKLDGVVCSPWEVPTIKTQTSKNFLCVTPGIRLDREVGDQARVATPLVAGQNKADYLVVGRPITKAKDPVKIFGQIVEDFEKGFYEK